MQLARLPPGKASGLMPAKAFAVCQPPPVPRLKGLRAASANLVGGAFCPEGRVENLLQQSRQEAAPTGDSRRRLMLVRELGNSYRRAADRP